MSKQPTKPLNYYGVSIRLNLGTNETFIGSGTGDSWMDMAIVLEGLGVICKKCIEDGMNPKKVYGEVYKYFGKLADTYRIKHEKN